MIIVQNDNEETFGMYLPKRFNKLNIKQVKDLLSYEVVYEGSNNRKENQFISADKISFKVNKN